MSPARRRVLVVEDSLAVRQQARGLLEHLLPGCEVATTGDRREARELLYRWKPDVVLLDLTLEGGASGGALLFDLRTTPTRVVLMTAKERDDPQVTAALSLGAHHYLPKPLRREALTDALEAVGMNPLRW